MCRQTTCRQARASAGPSLGAADRWQRARIGICLCVHSAAPRPIDHGGPHAWGKVGHVGGEQGPARLGRSCGVAHGGVAHGREAMFMGKAARLGCRLRGATQRRIAPRRGRRDVEAAGVHLPAVTKREEVGYMWDLL